MGKMILCKGRYSDEPYSFRLTGTNVYSIEEICCYISRNIWLMNEEIFDLDLVRWTDEKIGLPLLAKKLENLIRRNAEKKDIVVTLCSGCDYFSDDEIKELVSLMDKSSQMNSAGRDKMKADILFEKNELRQAGELYRGVLAEMKGSPGEEKMRSDVFKKLGITELYSGSSLKAENYFREAYEISEDLESLTGFLLSVRFSGKKEESAHDFESLRVSSEEMEDYRDAMSQIEEEARKINEGDFSASLKKAFGSGRINEYYARRRTYMEKLKKKYRDMLVY